MSWHRIAISVGADDDPCAVRESGIGACEFEDAVTERRLALAFVLHRTAVITLLLAAASGIALVALGPALPH